MFDSALSFLYVWFFGWKPNLLFVICPTEMNWFWHNFLWVSVYIANGFRCSCQFSDDVGEICFLGLVLRFWILGRLDFVLMFTWRPSFISINKIKTCTLMYVIFGWLNTIAYVIIERKKIIKWCFEFNLCFFFVSKIRCFCFHASFSGLDWISFIWVVPFNQ